MNLTTIKDECYEAMAEAIKAAIDNRGVGRAVTAGTVVDANDGYIDMTVSRYSASVTIVHDNGNDHDCPLLCKAIEEALPDWDAIEEEWEEENPEEDEYEAHGFIDEADYLNWKFG